MSVEVSNLVSPLKPNKAVVNRTGNMGAPYNRPIILRSIHSGKRWDALTSTGQLGIMRRKLYVMPRGRRLNAFTTQLDFIAKHEKSANYFCLVVKK